MSDYGYRNWWKSGKKRTETCRVTLIDTKIGRSKLYPNVVKWSQNKLLMSNES